MRLTNKRKRQITLQIEHFACLLKKSPPQILFSVSEFCLWKKRQLDYAEKMYNDPIGNDCKGLCHISDPNMIFVNVTKHTTEKDLEDTIAHEMTHLAKSYEHSHPAFKKSVQRLKKEKIKNGRIVKKI
jgi:hypothetical protein